MTSDLIFDEDSTTLNLSGLGLTNIPAEVFDLANLTYLYLFNNSLEAIPDGITNLKNLTSLWVDRNQLDIMSNSTLRAVLNKLRVIDKTLIIVYSIDQINIGCKRNSVDTWIDIGPDMGRRYGYTEEEIGNTISILLKLKNCVTGC